MEIPERKNGTDPGQHEAVKAFLEGQDFLRLGHSISSGRWSSVIMTVRRMQETCRQLELTCFDRWLSGIRECALKNNKAAALQLMAQITAKRVQLRREMNKSED